MTERLSPLLKRGCLSTCGSSRHYLGSRATMMGCRPGEGGKATYVSTITVGRTLFRDSGTQNSLLSDDFLSEISVIFCSTPALKLSHSGNGRRVSPLAIGPSKMQKDLAFNASVHSDAAGRRNYEQDETAPAFSALPAHSLCFSGHLNPLLLLSRNIVQCSAGRQGSGAYPCASNGERKAGRPSLLP